MQFKTNILRVILASFISAAIAALWVSAEQMHWLIEFTEHEFIVLQTCAMIGGGIFAIQGALLLNGSAERINRMQHAILERNKVEFMALRDKKPAPMMFVVLIALATIILFQVGSMDFSTMHGAIVMFTLCGTFVVYFMTLYYMQDVRYIRWGIEPPPSEWLSEDVAKFFAERQKNSQAHRETK